MSWNVEEIIEALKDSAELKESVEPGLVQMKLFDSKNKIGIGIDSSGQRILVLPGQEGVASFTTKNADFDPACEVSWLEKGLTLNFMATLACRADFSNPSVLEAIAVIITGLIELELSFGNSGKAIWEMKALFDNNFEVPFSEETLVGLIGELLFINSSSEPNQLLKYWHQDISDAFDFSSSALRIEVKTSRSLNRNHRFSSNQIGSNLDSKVLIASIILYKVEVGSTLTQIVHQISSRVDKDTAGILMQKVLATIGCPLGLADGFKFDEEESINSLRIIEGVEIPRPTSTHGVVSMNWIANLTDVEFQDYLPENLIARFSNN